MGVFQVTCLIGHGVEEGVGNDMDPVVRVIEEAPRSHENELVFAHVLRGRMVRNEKG